MPRPFSYVHLDGGSWLVIEGDAKTVHAAIANSDEPSVWLTQTDGELAVVNRDRVVAVRGAPVPPHRAGQSA